MKKSYTFLGKLGWMAIASLFALPADAQKNLPEGSLPMIVAPYERTISSLERTFCVDVNATVPYDIVENADWLDVRKGNDGVVFFTVAQNYTNEPRVATVSFENAEQKVSRILTLTQKADNSAAELTGDIVVMPYKATDNHHQGSESVAKTIDGDHGTMYHSQWEPKIAVNEQNPAILTYEFKDVDYIDFINYVPRQGGGSNGNFGEVELLIKQEGDKEYKSYKTFDWGMSGSMRTINFKGGLQKPTGIQFRVYSGVGDFASCAEMEFRKNAPVDDDFNIFADDVYSELKPDFTMENLDTLENPMAKSLAYQMLTNSYDKKYRVGTYECFLSYVTLSEYWRAPGKFYDQVAGVTGINIPAKSKNAVVVSGIPEDMSVELRVVAWYVGKIGNNFDGGNPETTIFRLKNGINVIDYKHAYDGLAYVCYYSEDNPRNHPDIKVHFVNGQVNGYLSPEKTNDEMHEICKNAKNRCMDLYGKKVHQIWESKALYNYCRSTEGKLGYRQYLNTIDSLIVWEHRSLGFEKYGHIPTNRTMAYVNYTYYMFQGGFGVSFHMNQQSRILNCKNLIENDNDAIWGLSHEWGHQHQMHPHFCWSGMTEVSNNMQSYYNLMKMGFRQSDKIAGWPAARAKFLNEDFKNPVASEQRKIAYDNRSKFAYSQKLNAACEAMKNNKVPTAKENAAQALSYVEVELNETLCPLIMLHNYFTTHGFPDFMPDWYEALRQSDNENGSVIEKQSGIDKYEIIASCQNGNVGNKLKMLREKYPNSCWVKDNYIDEKNCNQADNAVPFIMNFCRKVSRLCGYNLMPYFEQWGYLRQIAVGVSDYGIKYYIMTSDMYNEFKADMDALVASGELKAMPEGMVDEISNCPDWFQKRPDIAN